MKIATKRPSAFTLVEIMIVVAVIGVILAIAVPSYVKTRERSQANICIENLSQIESAKQQLGVETGKPPGVQVTAAELIGPTLYMKKTPICPGGGTYDYKWIGTNAVCDQTGHVL